jgi:pilus assembly protein Flp/PilA
MQFIRNFIREEEGQGLVEYGIIVGLVSVAAIVALTVTGTNLSGLFDLVNGAIPVALPAGA